MKNGNALIFTELSPLKSPHLLIYLDSVGIMICDVKGVNG